MGGMGGQAGTVTPRLNESRDANRVCTQTRHVALVRVRTLREFASVEGGCNRVDRFLGVRGSEQVRRAPVRGQSPSSTHPRKPRALARTQVPDTLAQDGEQLQHALVKKACLPGTEGATVNGPDALIPQAFR